MPRTHRDPALAHALRRRDVLGVAAGTAAAAVLGAVGAAHATAADGGGRGAPAVPRGRLGIQLYTVRDQVAALGFGRVFEELRAHGYEEVEFAGYTQDQVGPLTLAELRRLLADNGLRAVGSHVDYWSDDPDAYTFATRLEQVLDDAEALGLRHIGTASSPARYGTTVDAWKRAAEEFNTYGEAARARGMTFYHHNHVEEFAFAADRPDVRLYDLLLAETDRDLVHLEMDVYWASCGQYRYSVRPDGVPAPFEPLDYVRADPGRYPLFHVKDGEHDETSADGYRMVDVGDGDLDYRRFLAEVGRLPGRRGHHWLVERDDAVDPEVNPAGSLTTARRSAAYLRSLRTGRARR